MKLYKITLALNMMNIFIMIVNLTCVQFAIRKNLKRKETSMNMFQVFMMGNILSNVMFVKVHLEELIN